MKTLQETLVVSVKENREKLEQLVEKLENRIREDKAQLNHARQSLVILDDIDSLAFEFDFDFEQFDEIDE